MLTTFPVVVTKWNIGAHFIAIEAPVGVGFSYAEDGKAYHIGDYGTAEENYNFIIGFLTRFPALQKNVLISSSESYGGHYMPTLAKTILQKQAEPDVAIKLKFKVHA